MGSAPAVPAAIPVPAATQMPPGIAALPSASAAFRARAGELGIDLSGDLGVGDVEVDLELYEVRRGSRAVELSPRQVELLAVFLAAPGRVFSRDQLHWLCWQDISPSRRVDVQLCRIRAKVGIELFRNVRDRGWALRPRGYGVSP